MKLKFHFWPKFRLGVKFWSNLVGMIYSFLVIFIVWSKKTIFGRFFALPGIKMENLGYWILFWQKWRFFPKLGVKTKEKCFLWKSLFRHFPTKSQYVGPLKISRARVALRQTEVWLIAPRPTNFKRTDILTFCRKMPEKGFPRRQGSRFDPNLFEVNFRYFSETRTESS